MPEIKLKPCPFCGGKAALNQTGNAAISFVKCLECGAQTDIIKISTAYCSNDKAIEVWNRRAKNE